MDLKYKNHAASPPAPSKGPRRRRHLEDLVRPLLALPCPPASPDLDNQPHENAVFSGFAPAFSATFEASAADAAAIPGGAKWRTPVR